jgi:hypothetical protein
MKTLARERDVVEIRRRLQTVSRDSRRRWGRMTAHQMICHSSDSFLAVTGRRHTSMAIGPLQRTVLEWTAWLVEANGDDGDADPTRRHEVTETHGGCPAETVRCRPNGRQAGIERTLR